MKRIGFLLLIALVATAAVASTVITIDPSEMKSGETKTIVDGDKTIKLSKDGEEMVVRIEGAGKTRKITITHDADGVRIVRGDGSERTWVVPPIIEGFGMPEGARAFRFKSPMKRTVFVCPKDHTTLRVPTDKLDETYKCPVDGTVMEKKKTSGLEFFFDDIDGESI
jgi:hypothetical protein